MDRYLISRFAIGPAMRPKKPFDQCLVGTRAATDSPHAVEVVDVIDTQAYTQTDHAPATSPLLRPPTGAACCRPHRDARTRARKDTLPSRRMMMLSATISGVKTAHDCPLFAADFGVMTGRAFRLAAGQPPAFIGGGTVAMDIGRVISEWGRGVPVPAAS
ncbi:hypothetical protein ABGV17_05925 [Guyparkeria sp. GHLCS8-2]|uniref:hypothetical protein n=1 Tax=Guyparkeria halopsychrophila TaxID=3139421 RepID=UPI0037C8A475